MFGYGGFGGRGKRKAPPENNSTGTGYSGDNGDTKKLVSGRKKAESRSTKDDKANIRFLKQIQKQMKYEEKNSWSKPFDLYEDDKKKVAALLAEIFRNQVPTDWDKRKDLYNMALDVTRALASNERLGRIFGDKDDQEGVLFWLIDFSQQAKQITNHNEELGYTKDDLNDVLLATQVNEVAEMALRISKRVQAPKQVADLAVVTLTERYQSELGTLRFDTVDSIQNHYFLKLIPSAPSILNTRNVFKELAAYRTALPVEYGSSCFCRVISNRLDMLRVMITGPDDTPYANGCFLFDINLPGTYPKVSPKVQFLTTGGGKLRFNPNLYNCGKVCLSLLGTWAGPGWVAGQSTLLQVLISIQSLILVPDPYYNEPAYDISRGTPKGIAASKSYNKTIRGYTISAAIESHLIAIMRNNNPYVEFEQAMIKHFLEKRSLIQKELWIWAKEDESLSACVSNVCTLLESLSNRERNSKRSKRARGVAAAAKTSLSDEPICLDLDSDVEEIMYTKPHNGPLKSDIPICLDLSDDEAEEKRGGESIDVAKNAGGAKSDVVVDLT
mmetsp:Transcript_9340/g.13873  ORF Transcript_9340/g.13873 Transcript_9340/m.13873 type:complete len:556 (-) Transcript_9340:128-1795(-)